MATKDPPTPTTSGCNSSSNNTPLLSPSNNPQPAPNSPSSTSTPGRRNLTPLPLTSSFSTTAATTTIPTGGGIGIPTSNTNRPSSHQKHRRVLSAVEGSAAQSFLISALDSLNADMPQPSLSAIAAAASSSTPPYRHKPHHRDMFPDTTTTADQHPPVPAATFTQWNNAALTKSQWDNGDADGLLLPPNDTCFDGSSSVAATAAASTSSHRSILSNPSDDDADDDDDDDLVVSDDHVPDVDPPSSLLHHPTSSSPSSSDHHHHHLDGPITTDQQPSSYNSNVKRVRVQQQLLHQRRLQNAQSRIRASQTPPPPPLSVMKCEDVSRSVDDWKREFSVEMKDLREMQVKGFEKLMSFMQGEANKRSAIESRLHAQLLLQSESMVAMELKLLRLEAKVHQKEQRRFQRLGVITNTIEEDLPLDDILGGQIQSERRERDATSRMPERAVVSSGASLVSAVTATSGLEDGMSLREEDEEDLDDDGSASGDGSTVEGCGGGVVGGAVVRVDTGQADGQSDAPTGQSTNRPPTLDSILLNPTFSSVHSMTNESTRAIRPPPDPTDASSLATSVTSATLTSTVVTATTSSVVNPSGTTRILITTPNDNTSNNNNNNNNATSSSTPPSSSHPPISERPSRTSDRDSNIDELFGSMVTTPPHHHHRGDNPPRSRSQSPLTVPSIGTNTGERSSIVTYDDTANINRRGDNTPSITTASLNSGVSGGALSTAAVAPSRDFRSRRAVQAAAMAAALNNSNDVGDSQRPLANRVVSFVSPDEIFQASCFSEAGDSVTIPDELDNLSDMVDTFASGATRWREEYEARLDAIQKRWASE